MHLCDCSSCSGKNASPDSKENKDFCHYLTKENRCNKPAVAKWGPYGDQYRCAECLPRWQRAFPSDKYTLLVKDDILLNGDKTCECARCDMGVHGEERCGKPSAANYSLITKQRLELCAGCVTSWMKGNPHSRFTFYARIGDPKDQPAPTQPQPSPSDHAQTGIEKIVCELWSDLQKRVLPAVPPQSDS